MEDFITTYFLDPVINRTGYNTVNTVVYAIIAIISVYFIYRYFEKKKFQVDNEFILGVLSFVLLGSTVRVVTDSLDTGVFDAVTPIHEFIMNSHVYDYGFATATPGIYIIIAGLFLASFFIVEKLKKREWLKYIGLGLWVPHILLLIPFMEYIIYLIPVLFLALVPTLIALKYFNDWRYGIVVFGHSLDGGATFFTLDYFTQISGIQYFEQHVLSGIIGDVFGTFFAFYLIKVLISFLAAYFIKKEEMSNNERYYIIILITVVGLAPGIRNVLRMIIGG